MTRPLVWTPAWTPAWSRHRTETTGDEPLLLLWFYAPAGSERRWQPDDSAAAETPIEERAA